MGYINITLITSLLNIEIPKPGRLLATLGPPGTGFIYAKHTVVF